MRIFSECLEAAKEIERDLVELGVSVHPETMQDRRVADNPDYETRELVGYGYSIVKGWSTLTPWNTHFNLNTAWLDAEFSERVSGLPHNPGQAWTHRAEVWSEFLHHGRFAYTYAERLSRQLGETLGLLRQYPSTRQAVITIYDAAEDMDGRGGRRRVPCSMYYHFLIRQLQGRNYLALLYTMRSCDFYTHFPYDVALAISLQHYVAEQLNCAEGMFTHFIGSLHAYRKDYQPRGVF
jgi:thymidylate synthase